MAEPHLNQAGWLYPLWIFLERPQAKTTSKKPCPLFICSWRDCFKHAVSSPQVFWQHCWQQTLLGLIFANAILYASSSAEQLPLCDNLNELPNIISDSGTQVIEEKLHPKLSQIRKAEEKTLRTKSLERPEKNVASTIENSLLIRKKGGGGREEKREGAGLWRRINTCLYSSCLGFQPQCQRTATPDSHLCILPQPCSQHSVSPGKDDSHKQYDCQKANSSLCCQILLCTSYQHLKDISTGQAQ